MNSTVLSAVRVALDPSPSQERALSRHAGAARFAFNAALAHVKACLEQRAAEVTYGVPVEELTEVPWSLPALRRWWNAHKDQLAPWWAEQSKEAYNSGLDALARGLKNWTTSRSGKRSGARVGFPRFKKRARTRAAFRYTTGAYGTAGARRVKLPRIGVVHTVEALDRLDGARVVAVSVSRTAGRWFASFTIEAERTVPEQPSRRQKAGGVVGVDLGLKHLAVLSTGEMVANPKPLVASLRRLRKASRGYARTQRGSAGRRRAAGKLARIHARVANVRSDGLHQLTTRLVREHHTVVVEDLHVAGMVRNRRLSRAIADAGWAEARRQLTYKAAWCGGTLIVADRWFASSKTCSGCGAAKATLPLSERSYDCEPCGLVLDRDLNAARNLAALAVKHDVAGSGPETENGGGADRKTRASGQVAVKPQPRTTTEVGKTRTAAPQGEAA